MLSISLLGGFSIHHNQTPIKDVDTPRLQSLLAYLLLHCDAPQSRAHLAYRFWPDTSEGQARTNLRNLLHHLRRALPQADSYLDVSPQTLQWRCSSPFSLDVNNFETAISNAQLASSLEDAATIQNALALAVDFYKGDLLPSCYDDWIIPYREGLRQAYLRALEKLVQILEDQRDYPAAIQYAQCLLRYDPLHEATYRNLIRLHALNQDRASALRVYHACTNILQRELEVEPSAATRKAYEQLLGSETQPSTAIPATTAYYPLVGRKREWAQILKVWRSVAIDGEPRCVLISGEAGVGKTKLVEELLQWTARQGIESASARCYAAEGDLNYTPVIAWLRAHPLAPMEDIWLTELARLLPEILTRRPDLPKPAAITESWQRQRLFEALSRAILTATQPILLTIEDLQWCDRDTLEWLHFLLRYGREKRLLVVGSYRPEEIEKTHPLVSLIQALRLEGQVTEIDLQPLDQAATQSLASHIAGVPVSAETAQILFRETEGNPLFVVEIARTGIPDYDRALKASRAGSSLPGGLGLPPKVLSVLETRLAQVSPETQELARLAATIGRAFNFRLLAEASKRDEGTLVRQLDELWQRRIIRELGSEAYDFSHDKLREVTYGSMSAARRRLLHHHVAQALEARFAADLDSVSYQLASHYERAGMPAQAIPYYLRAAEVARRVFANQEAIALLQRGLAIVQDEALDICRDGGTRQVAAHLYEGLGDILELTAQYEAALQAYASAQTLVHPEDWIRKARLHRKAGAVLREERRFAETLDACLQAEIALRKQPDKETSLWWQEWIDVQAEKVWAHYWLAQWNEMEALLNQAEPFVKEGGSAASRERFLTASCLMLMRRDRYVVSDQILSTALEALHASRESGDLKATTNCQFEVGFLYLWRREFDAAEANLQSALTLAETYGVAWIRTITLNYLAVLRRFQGQVDAVRDYAQRTEEAALTTQMPDYVAAANGNLAWVAWRQGNPAEAEARSQAALQQWRKSAIVYPFLWIGLWPLLAVSLARGWEGEAWSQVQALLEPKQQRLPDALDVALAIAFQAKESGLAGEALLHLDRAMGLAREMGYL